MFLLFLSGGFAIRVCETFSLYCKTKKFQTIKFITHFDLCLGLTHCTLFTFSVTGENRQYDISYTKLLFNFTLGCGCSILVYFITGKVPLVWQIKYTRTLWNCFFSTSEVNRNSLKFEFQNAPNPIYNRNQLWLFLQLSYEQIVCIFKKNIKIHLYWRRHFDLVLVIVLIGSNFPV